MSYRDYVVAAYTIFIVAMLWDWLSPKWQVRQLLRAAKLRAMRTAARTEDAGSR